MNNYFEQVNIHQSMVNESVRFHQEAHQRHIQAMQARGDFSSNEPVQSIDWVEFDKAKREIEKAHEAFRIEREAMEKEFAEFSLQLGN